MRMLSLLVATACTFGVTLAAEEEKKPVGDKKDGNLTMVISTDKGEINVRLFADKTPVTVASFVNLAERGFYDGLIFHRVIANFMIQGGCPLGRGNGDPGYRFEDECQESLKHSKGGILSMANSGPRTNGSQFFITHNATPHLDGKHTVFGEVVGEADLAVVNKIGNGDKIKSITIKGDTTELKKKTADRLKEWNAVLTEKFPKLKKASE